MAKKTHFLTYDIDKADFISLIQKARQNNITSRNIQLVWQAIGLISYNQVMVFQKLSVYEKNILASNKGNIRAVSNTPNTLI